MHFFEQKQNQCLFVKTQKTFEAMTLEQVKILLEFVKNFSDEILFDVKWVVVDMPQLKSFHPNCIPMLCRIASHLEQKEIKMALIANQNACDLICKNAIDRMVLPYTSLDSFSKSNGISSKENIKIFLNTLLESVISTMKVLIETDIEKKSVELIKDPKSIPPIQAGAIAGIVSNHFSGSIAIGFNAEVFKKMMSVFLQMEIEHITAEIKDGAAELLNVIIGQTKIKLNEKGFEIRQVIPNVITGDQVIISPMAKQNSVLIKCDSELGSFIILLTTN